MPFIFTEAYYAKAVRPHASCSLPVNSWQTVQLTDCTHSKRVPCSLRREVPHLICARPFCIK
jgi:hypothetical protein